MCLDFYGLLNTTDLTYAQNENKKFVLKCNFYSTKCLMSYICLGKTDYLLKSWEGGNIFKDYY